MYNYIYNYYSNNNVDGRVTVFALKNISLYPLPIYLYTVVDYLLINNEVVGVEVQAFGLMAVPGP